MHPRFEFRPKSRNLAYMNPRLEPITEHKLTFQFKLRTDAETYFKPNRTEMNRLTALIQIIQSSFQHLPWLLKVFWGLGQN